MGRTVDDFSAAAKPLRELVETNEPKFEGIVDDLAGSSKRMSQSGANIDNSSIAVKDPVNNLKKGEGALGRAIKDEILHEKPLKSTANLDSLITDLKENPQKHIHFSIF